MDEVLRVDDREVAVSGLGPLATGFLAEASHALASSLDYAITLNTVARQAVPAIADCCMIYLLDDDGSVRRAAAAHRDPERQALMLEILSRYPVSTEARMGTSRVLRDGTSELISEIPDSTLVELARDARHLEFLRAEKMRSLMSVPLSTRGRTIGAITLLSSRPDRRYQTADLVLAEELARRAALAVDNARLYRAACDARAAAEEALAERRRLEDQLVQAQKMESLGRLAGGVAHDFNNLLTTLSGYSEILLQHLQGTPLGHYAERIHSSASRGSALSERLLGFCRKRDSRVEVIDLNEIVRGLDGVLAPALVGIRLETVLDEGPALVEADAGELEQVVLNLALNARDAMTDGGLLRIVVMGSAVADERWVVLRVSDTGHGMDAVTRDRVFEPFFTTKASGRGTGLGLFTVYGTTQRYGGSIEVETRPGYGSTFEIKLPRARPSVTTAKRLRRTIAPLSETPCGKGTILVVEDDSDVRSLLSDVLAFSGYEVIVASGGSVALDVVERHRGPIDLLLTDIVMPDLNGCELAQKLQLRCPELRVLFMSGYSSDMLDRYGVSPESVVPKPYSISVLRQRIHQALLAPAE
jgi:signal transduction histidine kinase